MITTITRREDITMTGDTLADLHRATEQIAQQAPDDGKRIEHIVIRRTERGWAAIVTLKDAQEDHDA